MGTCFGAKRYQLLGNDKNGCYTVKHVIEVGICSDAVTSYLKNSSLLRGHVINNRCFL